MQLIVENLRIPVEEDGAEAWLQAVLQRLGLEEGVRVTRILSKTLDLRDPAQFFYDISLVVDVPAAFDNREGFPPYEERPVPPGRRMHTEERPLVVGFGPAGMFAALELLEHGLKPRIFERGRRIGERVGDVARFIGTRVLDPESNIQFGEGGAGSFSDGKLFSRRNRNTGPVSRVLDTFVRFGAPSEIGYVGKPHLGTDVLRRIVRNIRNHILDRGGEIRYGARMTDLLVGNGRVRGLVINGEEEVAGSDLYLAMGHSARETFAMLHEKGVAMERRPIAVGLRIEHPAATINRMRYGEKYWNFKPIGAATYSLNYTDREAGRGVYTFCMCPGGEVVNASSEQGGLVLNGMSYSHRGSPHSNAALVVSCHGEDYDGGGPLAGFAFQRRIEERAFRAGGGTWAAPAQMLRDFLGRGGGGDFPVCSYAMGLAPADMHDIFPGFIAAQLRAAFLKWEREVPLFVAEEALLLGPETRTSAPVRILRDENGESLTVRGLYPIGEGSGHTGGITSSAADGLRAVARRLDL